MYAGVQIIIDGYNLLHATHYLGRKLAPDGLQRARQSLLKLLSRALPEQQLPRTVVVFDAHNAPYGLSRQSRFEGMLVYFATKHEDADALIEELILQNSTPKRLVVVSGDHRLHKAARRRKATAIDSDLWLAEVLQEYHQRKHATPPETLKALEEKYGRQPTDVRFWLQHFLDDTVLDESELSPEPLTQPMPPVPKELTPKKSRKQTPVIPTSAEIEESTEVDLSFDPFPPDYVDKRYED